MCLIALAFQVHRDLPLVVAANRDEWRDRPAAPLAFWSDRPEILAGRDLAAGGTWMGITRTGRFAAVTNYRDPSERRAMPRSRGALVIDALLSPAPPDAFLRALRPEDYAGFNLIVGDEHRLFYYGSREGEVREISPGVHALSNHLLNEPWPKVLRAREALEPRTACGPSISAEFRVARGATTTDTSVSRGGATKRCEGNRRKDEGSKPFGVLVPSPPDDERLFAMLSDTHVAPDEQLPQTGVGIEWERRLSPPLITGADYGTRTSSVVRIGARGAVRVEERTRDASGAVVGVVAVDFERR